MTDRFPSFACLAVAALIGFASPASAQTTTVHLKNTTGADVGTVTATEVDDGVLMKVAVKGLPPGTHAFHVHAVGKCEPPFTSAGGHFNPDHKSHGMMAEHGYHAGDMPNLTVAADGTGKLAYTLAGATLAGLLDADGSAFVVHAMRDDQRTDPSGMSGDRIACGVFKAG